MSGFHLGALSSLGGRNFQLSLRPRLTIDSLLVLVLQSCRCYLLQGVDCSPELWCSGRLLLFCCILVQCCQKRVIQVRFAIAVGFCWTCHERFRDVALLVGWGFELEHDLLRARS